MRSSCNDRSPVCFSFVSRAVHDYTCLLSSRRSHQSSAHMFFFTLKCCRHVERFIFGGRCQTKLCNTFREHDDTSVTSARGYNIHVSEKTTCMKRPGKGPDDLFQKVMQQGEKKSFSGQSNMLESDQTIDLSSERHGLSESIVSMGQLIPKACPTWEHMPRWSVIPNMFTRLAKVVQVRQFR